MGPTIGGIVEIPSQVIIVRQSEPGLETAHMHRNGGSVWMPASAGMTPQSWGGVGGPPSTH